MTWLAIAHHLPERTRLRTPVLRNDVARCERVAEALCAVPGVRAVDVRPYTGSVLVTHAADVAVSILVTEAQRVIGVKHVLAVGEAPPVEGEPPAFSAIARKLVVAVRDIDRDIRRASDGSVDLGTLATLGLLGAGAAEVATTGNLPIPPWFNLAWWGFRTFVTTEKQEIAVECEPE